MLFFQLQPYTTGRLPQILPVGPPYTTFNDLHEYPLSFHNCFLLSISKEKNKTGKISHVYIYSQKCGVQGHFHEDHT